MSSFTREQLQDLEVMFIALGKEILDRANRDYCDGSSSVDAVSNVGTVIENFEPRFVVP